jgi:D-ribose pyranose/furanose isomerase RbsD
VKRGGILNQALSGAIAGLGHGDLLLVVDAGFPIPRDAERIDLAIARDLPDLRTVLHLINQELIAERVVIAAEMAESNAPLEQWLRAEFVDAEFELVSHEEMLTSVPRRAKAIVRTGAFDPWGNIALSSGVDLPAWFSREGVLVPEYYAARLERARAGGIEG